MAGLVRVVDVGAGRRKLRRLALEFQQAPERQCCELEWNGKRQQQQQASEFGYSQQKRRGKPPDEADVGRLAQRPAHSSVYTQPGPTVDWLVCAPAAGLGAPLIQPSSLCECVSERSRDSVRAVDARNWRQPASWLVGALERVACRRQRVAQPPTGAPRGGRPSNCEERNGLIALGRPTGSNSLGKLLACRQRPGHSPEHVGAAFV